MKKVKEYKYGAKHRDFHGDMNVTGSASVGKTRFIIEEGHFSVSHMTKDFKYPQEIQLHVWSDKVKEQPRGTKNQNWNRIELIFHIQDFLGVLKVLEDVREAVYQEAEKNYEKILPADLQDLRMGLIEPIKQDKE